MQGDFDLEQGDVIKLLVGQTGVVNTGYSTSGGGGGTFVVTSTDTPLLVAGGGGGIESLTSRLANSDANTGTSGRNNQCASSCANWAGGTAGNGGLEADTGNSGTLSSTIWKIVKPQSVYNELRLCVDRISSCTTHFNSLDNSVG